MQTLREMWQAAFYQNPDQIAVADEHTQRTYLELSERAKRLGSALFASGLRKGDRVAVLSRNRTEWFDIYAACNIAGFIVNTVNFRLVGPEISYILNDAGSKVLFYEDQFSEVVDSIKGELHSVRRFVRIGEASGSDEEFENMIADGAPEGPPLFAEPDDPAHLIYTSGTTGRPKGVIRSQKAEVANALALAGFMEMRFGSSLLLMMPVFHVGALLEAFGQIYYKGTVHLLRDFDPAKVADTLATKRIEATHMAPVMVQAFLDLPDLKNYDFLALRTLCYAAAPMPVSVLRRGIEMLGPIFVDCYGATEVGAATALYKPFHKIDGTEEEIARLASVGQPLPTTRIRILDDDGLDLRPGEIGEVTIKSEVMLDYYWNNTVATMESIVDGWYRTGDVGYMDEQGFLFLVDRKKDMIISGGENIYCREVEEALLAHPDVADVAVIGVPDEKWGEAVMAIVIRKTGGSVTGDELTAHCKTQIASYKRPKMIEFVESLPRLPSGKVSKVKLREQYTPRSL